MSIVEAKAAYQRQMNDAGNSYEQSSIGINYKQSLK